MSKIRKITLTCPKCKEEVEYDYYDSVNVSLDPSLKEKVFDRSIFIAKCPHCGNSANLIHPILYHDMEHKFMIQMDRYINLLHFKEQLKNNPLHTTFIPTILGVSSLGDLSDAVIAIENGLDYRVCQFVFRVMEKGFKRYCKDQSIKLTGPLYDGFSYEKDDEGNLVYEILGKINGEKHKYNSKFDLELYKEFETLYKEKLDKLDPFAINKDNRDYYFKLCNKKLTEEDYKNAAYYFVNVDIDNQLYLCGVSGNPTYKNGDRVNVALKGDKQTTGTVVDYVEYNGINPFIPDEYFGILLDAYIPESKRN